MSRLLYCLMTAALVACGDKAAEEVAPKPVALVEVQAAMIQNMQEILTAYGTADFSPTASTTVTVPVESQVESLLSRAGSRVKRGDPLLQLRPSPTTALEVGKAKNDAALAGAEVARLRRLRSEGLATESELQTAINAASTANQLRNSLVARVGHGVQFTLVAPRDGIVESLTAQPGEVLAAGSVAARVSSGESLRVRLGIEPAALPRIAIGQKVHLSTLEKTPQVIEATIDGSDPRIDAQTRQAAATTHLNVGSGVLPGAALRGEIVLASHAHAVTVPAAALVYVDDAPLLFVVVDGKALRREVKTGIRDGDAVEITEGLKAGERAVIAGNSVLEDGMAVRTEAAAAP